MLKAIRRLLRKADTEIKSETFHKIIVFSDKSGSINLGDVELFSFSSMGVAKELLIAYLKENGVSDA